MIKIIHIKGEDELQCKTIETTKIGWSGATAQMLFGYAQIAINIMFGTTPGSSSVRTRVPDAKSVYVSLLSAVQGPAGLPHVSYSFMFGFHLLTSWTSVGGGALIVQP